VPEEIPVGYGSHAELNSGVHDNVNQLKVVFSILGLQVEMVIHKIVPQVESWVEDVTLGG